MSKLVCADSSGVARQNSKGGSFNGRGRKGERHKTNSKLLFSQTFLSLFVTQNTPVLRQNWKPTSKDIMYLHVDCKSYGRVRMHTSMAVHAEIILHAKEDDF